jgi:GH18 family chitinase
MLTVFLIVLEHLYFKFKKELREAFYVEAMKNRKEQLLLSVAVAAEKYTIMNGYEIENVVPHIDFINLMSYDYHGSWDRKLGITN